MAVQEGPTAIKVSWNPSNDATGHRIHYSNGDSSNSVDTNDGSTDKYLLTGLQNGDTYTISIMSVHEYSLHVL